MSLNLEKNAMSDKGKQDTLHLEVLIHSLLYHVCNECNVFSQQQVSFPKVFQEFTENIIPRLLILKPFHYFCIIPSYRDSWNVFL